MFAFVVLVSHLPPHARDLRLDRLVVTGAGGLLCPGSPDVLGDIGRLVVDAGDDYVMEKANRGYRYVEGICRAARVLHEL